MDLVQFPQPVYITEVRIIPLGARVQADFPGGVRLGATNPSKFHIELFVNDLAKPGASTFERLGDFEYNQNDCINLQCATCTDRTTGERQIPTDGLVLRGLYTTITLAVYGSMAKDAIGEPQISSPPAPLVTVEQLTDALAVQSQIAIATPDGKIVDPLMDIDKDVTYASDLVAAQLTPGPPTTPQTPKDSARQYTENWVASTGVAKSPETSGALDSISHWTSMDADGTMVDGAYSSPTESRRSPEYRRRRSYDRGVLDKKLLKTREYCESPTQGTTSSNRDRQRGSNRPSVRGEPQFDNPLLDLNKLSNRPDACVSPELVHSPSSQRRPRTPEAQHPSKAKYYASSVQSPQSTTDADTDAPANTSGPISSLAPTEPDDDAMSQGNFSLSPLLSAIA